MSDSGVFVVQNSLRPGDVILTMGTGKFSDGIARATGSRFSHAILIIEAHRWFEADDDGVGFSEVLTCGGWHDGPGVHEWVTPLPGCADALVLRHPSLITRDPGSIRIALERIVTPWAGADYSDYRRLVHPLAVGGRPSWLVTIGLLITQLLDPREATGMFCSEVVARAFEAMVRDSAFADASLFRAPRRAELVAPGHLADSLLTPVSAAVLRADRLPADHRIGEGVNTDRRGPTKLARSRRITAALQARFDEAVAASIDEARRVTEAAHASVECELNEALATARRWDAANATGRLEKLGEAMKALALRDENSRRNRPADLEQAFEISLAWIELEFSIHATLVQAQEELLATLEGRGITTRSDELRALIEDSRGIIARERDGRRKALDGIRREHGLPPA
jgi:hypothetical protein